jgi:hypothetical protein
MLLKILGAVILIWAAFAVIGFIFKAFVTLLIIGVVVAVIGGVGYALVKGSSERRQIR